MHAPKQSPAADGARPARRAGDTALALALAASVLLHGLMMLAVQRAAPTPAARLAEPQRFTLFELAPVELAPVELAPVELAPAPGAQPGQITQDVPADAPPTPANTAARQPIDSPGTTTATDHSAEPPPQAATAPQPAARLPAPEPTPEPSPKPSRVADAEQAPMPVPRAPRRVATQHPTEAPRAAIEPAAEAPARTDQLAGIAALDAEIAAMRRRAEQSARPKPEPAAPGRDEDRSGLAALDAEIAASRQRAGSTQPARADAPAPQPPPQAERQPAPRAGKDRSGLAALDADIAASRRADAPGAKAMPDRKPGRSSNASPAVAPARQQAAGPAARDGAERSYLAALRSALERQRSYPPAARQRRLEGTARVQFTIAANGVFSGIRLSQSTGVAALDAAAEHTVRRLGRFEPIPAVLARSQWTVRVPIVFRLN